MESIAVNGPSRPLSLASKELVAVQGSLLQGAMAYILLVVVALDKIRRLDNLGPHCTMEIPRKEQAIAIWAQGMRGLIARGQAPPSSEAAMRCIGKDSASRQRHTAKLPQPWNSRRLRLPHLLTQVQAANRRRAVFMVCRVRA